MGKHKIDIEKIDYDDLDENLFKGVSNENLKYIEDKVKNDVDMKKIAEDNNFSIDKIVNDINKIKKILHVRTKDKVDKKNFYNITDVPESSEDTLIRELDAVNSWSYSDDTMGMSDFEKKKVLLKTGKYKGLVILRKFQISYNDFVKKMIREKFIKSYGSTLFSKVSEWIVEENNIYSNLDRIKIIEEYNKKKIKISKKNRRQRR